MSSHPGGEGSEAAVGHVVTKRGILCLIWPLLSGPGSVSDSEIGLCWWGEATCLGGTLAQLSFKKRCSELDSDRLHRSFPLGMKRWDATRRKHPKCSGHIVNVQEISSQFSMRPSPAWKCHCWVCVWGCRISHCILTSTFPWLPGSISLLQPERACVSHEETEQSDSSGHTADEPRAPAEGTLLFLPYQGLLAHAALLFYLVLLLCCPETTAVSTGDRVGGLDWQTPGKSHPQQLRGNICNFLLN